MGPNSKSQSDKFSSERLVYNLSGFFCLVMILLLGLSTGHPDGRLMQSIGLFWHIVGIVVFFIVGLFSVMCIIHVNSIDRHPSMGRARNDFHSLRPIKNPAAYRREANSNSGARRLANH